jgi:hypothetical protein
MRMVSGCAKVSDCEPIKVSYLRYWFSNATAERLAGLIQELCEKFGLDRKRNRKFAALFVSDEENHQRQ